MRLSTIAAVALALASPIAHAEPRAVPAYSIWSGSYTCAQGVTAVRLTIEARTTGGPAMALFQFGPHTDNRHLPTGSFWMTGHIERNAQGQLVVALVPDRWKQQPAGWVMVPLAAVTDREERTLSGAIQFEGCGAFTAQRVAN